MPRSSETGVRQPDLSDPLWTQGARAAITLAVAGLASYLAWRHVGGDLNVTTDIVGSTIFTNFNVYRLLGHFYVALALFPALAVAVYLVVGRWGPLASRPMAAWPPALLVAESSAAPIRHTEGRRLQLGQVAGVLVRLGLPALVIAVEVGIGASERTQALSPRRGVAAGLGYAAVVASVALLVRRRWGRRLAVWSAVNAVAAIVVIPLLLVVSAATAVSIESTGAVVAYPWLPVWLAVLATAVALAVVATVLLRGGWAVARRLERGVLLAVVVPVGLFLATATLQGAQDIFNGFDDAQAMVGARLMFGHGLWPWRDAFLLHGFFADGLWGAVGMWAFGGTRWASNTGLTFLVGPATILVLYAFIVYFARRNYALALAGCLGLILGLLNDWPGTRFALMPLVLIGLDLVLRRASWPRCVAFIGLVIFQSIVTPEATILVVGVLAVMVLAELVHRRRGTPWQGALRRTLRCATAGVALLAGWFLFLAVTGCLSGFVNYYRTTVSGHELWGAHSITFPFPGDFDSTFELVLPIALFLLTAARAAWKIQRRSPWTSADWVLVASATTVPLLFEIIFYRFDYGHVDIAFQAATPLVLLWVAEIVTLADVAVVRLASWMSDRTGLARAGTRPVLAGVLPKAITPAAILAVVAVVVLSPLQAAAHLAGRPSAFHVKVPVDAPTSLPLGYTLPGVIDATEVEDLKAVVDRYAGPSAPVFEFANEMGITYFLLDRVPGARFYHVESAQTAVAQQLEIDDLTRSRPPVVIFNDHSFGIPSYDGIWSMERNYLVSQYILDHYQPFADVHGQLVMLRTDLVATAPSLPPLHQPAMTDGLYFRDLPGCDWGDVPDFLKPPGTASIAAGVPASLQDTRMSASGWGYDIQAHRPAVAVLAVRDGVVIGQAQTSIARPDVVDSLHDAGAATSGWTMSLPTSATSGVTFYAVNADGTASLLPQDGGGAPPAAISTAQGATYRVVERLNSGHVDQLPVALVNLGVPGTEKLATYQWLELSSASGFNSHIIVTDMDVPQQVSAHNISFDALPRVGHTVYLRVGSCIQWHGYGARTLKLVDAPADVSVRLLP